MEKLLETAEDLVETVRQYGIKCLIALFWLEVGLFAFTSTFSTVMQIIPNPPPFFELWKHLMLFLQLVIPFFLGPLLRDALRRYQRVQSSISSR